MCHLQVLQSLAVISYVHSPNSPAGGAVTRRFTDVNAEAAAHEPCPERRAPGLHPTRPADGVAGAGQTDIQPRLLGPSAKSPGSSPAWDTEI